MQLPKRMRQDLVVPQQLFMSLQFLLINNLMKAPNSLHAGPQWILLFCVSPAQVSLCWQLAACSLTCCLLKVGRIPSLFNRKHIFLAYVFCMFLQKTLCNTIKYPPASVARSSIVLGLLSHFVLHIISVFFLKRRRQKIGKSWVTWNRIFGSETPDWQVLGTHRYQISANMIVELSVFCWIINKDTEVWRTIVNGIALFRYGNSKKYQLFPKREDPIFWTELMYKYHWLGLQNGESSN